MSLETGLISFCEIASRTTLYKHIGVITPRL